MAFKTYLVKNCRDFFNGMEFLVTHAVRMATGEIHVAAEALAGVEPLEAWSPMTL